MRDTSRTRGGNFMMATTTVTRSDEQIQRDILDELR